jgi:hypothetical protein
MVQQLVQGGMSATGGGLVIGRQRGREFRHDAPVERGRGVASVAGELGAGEPLLPAGQGVYGLRGPSDLTWYAFATASPRPS